MHHDNDDNDWGCGPRWSRDDRRWEDRQGGRAEARGPRGPRGGYPGRGPREEFGGRAPHERGRDRDRDRARDRDRNRGGAEFGGLGAFFGPEGPFGPHGPFGPNGPFGANGPFGEAGPFGRGGPFGGQRWQGYVASGGRPDDEGRGRRSHRGGAGQRGHRGGGAQRGGRARRGDVRLAVLGLLAEENMNGYQLIRALEERTGGAWRPSPGAIYPALAQLEDEGLIAPADGGRKVFTLTEAGRAEVEQLGERVRPWQGVAEDLTAQTERGLGGTAELWMALGQLGLATRAVGQAGDPDVTRAAVELLEESRRGLYRLLAQQRADDLADDDVQDDLDDDLDDDVQDAVPGDRDADETDGVEDVDDAVIDGEIVADARDDVPPRG